MPVRPGLGDAVGQVLPVIAEGKPGDGHRSILGPLVRIENGPGRTVELVHYIEDVLVLEAIVFGVEIVAALLKRRRVFLEVPYLRQSFTNRLPLRNRFEITEG